MKSLKPSTVKSFSHTFVIVESPAKSKTISKFLPKNYIVDYCAGHIRDFPSSTNCPADLKTKVVLDSLKLTVGGLGIDVENDFQPIYAPMETKLEVIARLKKQAKLAKNIILATDEDREGEAISWHLLEVLKPKVPCRRAVFNEITESAVLEAFDNARDIDMDLVSSQEARKLLDRLVGYSISPLLWRYIAPGLSAGRVQSCGLKLICDKERKRWGFKSSSYYSIQATFADSLNKKFFLSKLYSINNNLVANERDFDGLTGELSTDSQKKVLVQHLILLNENSTAELTSWLHDHASYAVVDVEVNQSSRQPPSPFITSTLQQEASRRMGLSPTMTMKLAQELYENGHITYMRTDSPTLSSTATTTAVSAIIDIFGREYLNDKGTSKNIAPKNAQEAHEAIRPAIVDGRFKYPEEIGVDGKILGLYALIYQRTLASQMKASQSQTKTYVIQARNIKKVDDDILSYIDHDPIKETIFRSSETIITFKGYQAAYALHGNGHYQATPPPSLYINLSKGQPVYLASELQSKAKNLMAISHDHDVHASLEQESESPEMESSTISGGIQAIQHHTRPPARYNEASFIKELEAIGVGRPSTYSKIFQILREREYAIVDQHSLIPTIKGMIVSSVIEKHFADLVDYTFTAGLEASLDSIAQGSLDKVRFLHDFYLGSDDHPNDGLLHKIAMKLDQNEIDHRESRLLHMPILHDIGVLQLSKNGIYIDCNTSSPLSGVDYNSSYDITKNQYRWKLPVEMEQDIRLVTRESIQRLLSTSLAMTGVSFGSIALSDQHQLEKQLTLKAGKYGKYVQLGDDDDKAKIRHSVPEWIDEHLSVEEIIEYIKLPKKMHEYVSDEGKCIDMLLDCNKDGFYLQADGYSMKYILSERYIHDVTEALVMDAMDYIIPEIRNERLLGMVRGDEVRIKRSKFGFYLLHGKMVAGLGKHDPQTISLDDALVLLSKRGKILGSMKKGGKRSSTNASSKEMVSGASDTTIPVGPSTQSQSTSTVTTRIKNSKTAQVKPINKKILNEDDKKPKRVLQRKRTGYQTYVREMLAADGELGDATKTWKSLSHEAQQVYRDKLSKRNCSLSQ